VDKATLVSLDIDAGTSVIAALDEAGAAPKVALWMTTPEHEDGRLVIASPLLDQSQPLRAYEQVARILHGRFVHEQPNITLFRMRDPFIQKLRGLFSHTHSVEGLRLGGQTIGDRFISDAYVYRIQ
jgi:hypothetical protein